MKDYGTKRVELAWVAAIRKHAPAALVLCIAILLTMALVVPPSNLAAVCRPLASKLFLAIVYIALACLAAYLFVEARQREESLKNELEEAQELVGLSERLTTTLRSIGEGVITTDVDGLVTFLNDVAVQLTGWAPGRAVGTSIHEVFQIIDADSRAPIEDPSHPVLSSGKRVSEDAHALLLARSGSEHPIAYRATPILDADDWMIGVVVVFQDVAGLRAVQRHREQLIQELSETNRKLREEVTQREEARRAALSLMQDAQLAQAAHKESEDRLRVLFEGIDDALFVHNPAGRILDCNKAAAGTLGFQRDELLAMNLHDILLEQSGDSTARCVLTKARLPIFVHVHTSTIRYDGNEAFLTVARDITELKKAQDELRGSNEQLRESNAALEEYARVASHDLQEPLRKVESFAQVLLEDYGDKVDDQGRGYLDIMVNSAGRMRRLIRDVRAFSRAGNSERPFAPVDLNRVLAVVKDNLSERINERQAVVIAHDLPTVFADETQMTQLFQNLVGNGLKFNDKTAPKVEVFSAADGSEWKVFVRDNGIGMRPADTQSIFAPFKRLHSRDKFEGTGIGLAICRRIVARHGGQIGVQAEPEKGSTFWLTLPKTTPQFPEERNSGINVAASRKEDRNEPNHARTDTPAAG